MNRAIVLHVCLSFLMFCFAFYSFAGESGGDMAIMAMSVLFGFFQIIAVTIYYHFKKQSSGKILLAIIIAQMIQIFVFAQWGYTVNEWIKHYKFGTT